MSRWDQLLTALAERQQAARVQGGQEKLSRHRQAGKLSSRERMTALFDGGLFVELGALAANLTLDGDRAAPADGLIAGFGQSGGLPLLAMAEDFTVQAGSIGDAGAAKRQRITQLALQERLPLVIMLEGAGHRLNNSHATPAPNDLQGLAELSGLVPVVTLVLGPSAGHGALAAPMADFAVMTPAASLFVAGPPIVKAAIGEEVTKEALGGPDVHLSSGVVHNLAADDGAALDLARQFLTLLCVQHSDRPQTEVPQEEMLELIDPDPRIPFDMTRVLQLMSDPQSLLVLQPRYGGALVTALARIGGRSVAVLASNPMVNAGSIDAAAAQKAARFLALAGSFGLPVIFLADTPGVMPGTAAEKAGTLRHAAQMFAAQHRLKVPKIHVTVRKAFGFGSSVMAMNPFDGQTLNLAFPAISLGAMPAATGARSAGMSAAEQAKAVAAQAGAAWALADKMVYDDIIDPRGLRAALLAGLEMAASRIKRQP